ncbi:MAG: hypothetical protein OEU95_03940 [Nitrospirota bacterium]|nr:hypothetical protein [Nitrospirota bacterium]
MIITKAQAGPDAKAPAVYLNDILIAEIGGLRDGKIMEEDLTYEFIKAGVSRKRGK